MKVDKAAHCVGTQDQVSQNLRWANPTISPWPHDQASAPPGRWELLQGWLGLVCSRLGGLQGHPWPSLLLPRRKPSACCVNWQLTWRFFRKPKFLELDFQKKSVRSPRAFCQLDPQTRKTSGPWEGAAKASLKPTFTCGICQWSTSAANACWASCSGASSAPHKTNDDEVA